MRIFNLFLFVCLMLVFSSCQEEVFYSCDERVDDWVKENLDEIRTMTRNEWKNLNEDVKKGCYVAFTQQQKVDFWKGKFIEALELDWTPEEAEHIKLMYKFVDEHPEYFDYSREKTDEEIETFEIFTYEWIEKAKQEFKWSKKTIGGLIATGHTLIDKGGAIQYTPNITMTKAPSEVKCNCSTESNWCSIDYNIDCIAGGCEEDVNDCGTLWMYDCDGRCNGV